MVQATKHCGLKRGNSRVTHYYYLRSQDVLLPQPQEAVSSVSGWDLAPCKIYAGQTGAQGRNSVSVWIGPKPIPYAGVAPRFRAGG